MATADLTQNMSGKERVCMRNDDTTGRDKWFEATSLLYDSTGVCIGGVNE